MAVGGRDIAVLVPRPAGDAPTARLGSMYGYGVGYAVASLSCTIAPFLAVVSMTFRQGAALAGVLAFVAYAVGMSITVGVAALAVAWAGSSAARRCAGCCRMWAGSPGMVVATGLYVGYYGYYEMRLYFAGADAGDPVIEAASAVQSWLAGHVDALGAWGLLGAIGALVAGALGWRALVGRLGTRNS